MVEVGGCDWRRGGEREIRMAGWGMHYMVRVRVVDGWMDVSSAGEWRG